ncbi:hypothetical protein HC031_01840 [Planosporangium thailandense]|uniref:Uncharacterized protein n=1 Tax=Planosporangium thailandense TaxID=765197 RepID=A0ABX0XRL5_9ACTN|nr:hypothetical protein [Planosporangium thailandense]NJC68471.1 hypothetical protein [Planosporangium thailandense]
MWSFGAVALAELIGLLVGWLIFKITSRWFPPLHLVVKYIDQMSQHHAAVAGRR